MLQTLARATLFTFLLAQMCAVAHAYPVNYLSAKLGASVATQAKIDPGSSVAAIMSDGPVSKGSFSFAGGKQARVFMVDLGQERAFDRVQFGSGGPGPMLKIEVSSRGADGPYTTVLDKAELAYWRIHRLPLLKARWVRFDLGEGEGVAVHSVRIYKGYEHPKLAEVTRLLHERIKPDIRGLDKFYAASAAGDWKKACKLLRTYYAETQKPDAPPDPNWDLSRVKALEEGKLDYAGISRQEKLPIDWSYSKNTDWYEHKNFLNRGSALGVPIDAHYHTGDKHWAEFAREMLYDWIDANPVPEELSRADYPPWRTLDSALRNRWLASRFSKATAGKDIDDELWANHLYLIWQHADYLRKDTFDGGNWLAMVSSEVLSVAQEFPEFKDQDAWTVFGASAFETNVLRDVYPDGKEVEDAPGYVAMAYAGMFGAFRSLEKAGVAVKPEVIDRLSKTPMFLASVLQPNGNHPSIGDSGGGPLGYGLGEQIERFKLEDVRYILTKGREGTKPALSSINYPNGQWSVMRSPYEELPWEDARHLVFKSSCGSHGHNDVLQITAYAYGRELLIDPGITSYEGADVERYLHTAYHNTICIDGKSLSRSPGKTEKWVSNAGMDYVFGTHHGYKLLDERRGVLFIKPGPLAGSGGAQARPDYWIIHDDITGEGTHTYDQNWHFPADAGLVEDAATRAVRTSFATGGNLLMVPADGSSMKSESFDFLVSGSKIPGQRDTPSKGWRYSRSGAPPQSFDLVLYPYRGGKPPAITVRKLAVSGLSDTDATALEIRIGDAVDYVAVSRAGAKKLSVPEIGLAVDGEIAVLRTKGGKAIRVSGANLKGVTFGGKTLFSAEQPAADVDSILAAAP